MWKEFRDFALHGNVVDLAVGFIMGAAFGKIVTSLVNDVLMPPLGLVLGKVDFSNLFISLSGTHYDFSPMPRRRAPRPSTTVRSSITSSSSSLSPLPSFCSSSK